MQDRSPSFASLCVTCCANIWLPSILQCVRSIGSLFHNLSHGRALARAETHHPGFAHGVVVGLLAANASQGLAEIPLAFFPKMQKNQFPFSKTVEGLCPFPISHLTERITQFPQETLSESVLGMVYGACEAGQLGEEEQDLEPVSSTRRSIVLISAITACCLLLSVILIAGGHGREAVELAVSCRLCACGTFLDVASLWAPLRYVSMY